LFVKLPVYPGSSNDLVQTSVQVGLVERPPMLTDEFWAAAEGADDLFGVYILYFPNKYVG
jgi:hypothetical protein